MSTNDSEERARLASLPIIDFPEDVAIIANTPSSTLEKLYAQGNGPRIFRIGRRRKTTPAYVAEWRDKLAEQVTS